MASPQATTNNQGRDWAIDFLRAACILYIVGYWHLVPYTQSFPGYASVYTECLKDIALGTFTFCSGLLLATRPFVWSWSNLATFYKRRLVRIYPLYMITLLLFGAVGIANSAVVVKALLFLSMFLPPAPYTLWFISMIFTFYLITPLLLWLSERPYVYLAASVALLGLGILIHLQIHALDTRMLQYLPCFLLGIAWQRIPATAAWSRRYWILILLALLGTFLLYQEQQQQWLSSALGRIPTIASGTILLYLAAKRFESHLQHQLIAKLAYASFGIYLFHRLVLHYLIEFYFPETGYLRLAYLLGVGMTLTIFLSYYIQQFYDRVLSRWSPGK